jgi:hypothetical protein
MGYRDIPKLVEIIGQMEDSLPEQGKRPMKPIILRHREFSNWPGYQLFGFFSCRTYKKQGIRGQTIFQTLVDPTMPAYFYNDKNNVQYAAIPDCDHNRKILTDPVNVRALLMPSKEDPVPVLTIVEAPQDLLDEIEAEKKKPAPKKTAAKATAGNDPFDHVPLNEKIFIDGEADNKQETMAQ